MTVCLVIIAIVLAQAGVGQEGHVSEPWVAWFVLVFVCIYIAAYAWSCKPYRLPGASLSSGSMSAVVNLTSLVHHMHLYMCLSMYSQMQASALKASSRLLAILL